MAAKKISPQEAHDILQEKIDALRVAQKDVAAYAARQGLEEAALVSRIKAVDGLADFDA